MNVESSDYSTMVCGDEKFNSSFPYDHYSGQYFIPEPTGQLLINFNSRVRRIAGYGEEVASFSIGKDTYTFTRKGRHGLLSRINEVIGAVEINHSFPGIGWRKCKLTRPVEKDFIAILMLPFFGPRPRMFGTQFASIKSETFSINFYIGPDNGHELFPSDSKSVIAKVKESWLVPILCLAFWARSRYGQGITPS